MRSLSKRIALVDKPLFIATGIVLLLLVVPVSGSASSTGGFVTRSGGSFMPSTSSIGTAPSRPSTRRAPACAFRAAGHRVAGGTCPVAENRSVGVNGQVFKFGGALVPTDTPTPPPPSGSASSTSGFVTRSGTQLMLNGSTYRFSGGSPYWLPWGDATELANAMTDAKAMNLKVLRVFASLQVGTTPSFTNGCQANQPGQTCWDSGAADKNPNSPGSATDMGSEGVYFQYWNGSAVAINTGATGLNHLDAAVKAARDNGLRLLITFVDGWDYYGGTRQYCMWHNIASINQCPQFYTDTNMQNDYKNYVSSILNRTNTLTGVVYKNDPTIFGWDLANEPQIDSATLATWANTMSNFVKGIDSNHLVAVGDTGVDWAALPDTTRLDQLLAVTNIDYASLHLYPYWGCGSSQSMVAAAVCDSNMTTLMNRAYTDGKPSVLMEFGARPVDPTYTSDFLSLAQTARTGYASGWIAWGMMAYSDISNAWMVSDFIFMNDGSQNDINLTSEAALINTP